MQHGWVHRLRARRERGDNERGATLVEAAIMIPLIVFLTFGAIEFGFAFNEQGTVRAGTRTAARAASAVPKVTDAEFTAAALDTLNTSVQNLANGQPDEVWIYRARLNGAGEYDKPGNCDVDCEVFKFDNNTKKFSTTAAPGGDPWNDDERDACPGSSDRVGVFLKVKHDFLTGLPYTGSRSIELTANTIMALEPSPGPTC